MVLQTPLSLGTGRSHSLELVSRWLCRGQNVLPAAAEGSEGEGLKALGTCMNSKDDAMRSCVAEVVSRGYGDFGS